MDNYSVSTYGDLIADQYDSLFSHIDPDLVDRLHELSGDGKVLELGIGTGRIALPLSERGVEVHGIDASPAMLEKLKGRDKNGTISVQIGSFAEFENAEKYDLIFVVFNTIFALLTQQDQISCFNSVVKALKPNGKFLIEAFVPDLTRFDKGQTIRTVGVSSGQVKLECSQHDVATQTVTSQLITIDNHQGIKASMPCQPIARSGSRIRKAWLLS